MITLYSKIYCTSYLLYILLKEFIKVYDYTHLHVIHKLNVTPCKQSYIVPVSGHVTHLCSNHMYQVGYKNHYAESVFAFNTTKSELFCAFMHSPLANLMFAQAIMPYKADL